MASRRTRIGQAERAVVRASRGNITVAEARRHAQAMVDAVACPDLMGAKEVAAELETTVPNLRKARLPEPVAEVSATRLWDADEVRRIARERRRRKIGQGGRAPHAEAKKRKG